MALACASLVPGAPAAFGQEWSDPTGDVTLPNSDVFCGAAIVDGETLHLFARFAGVPMSAQNHEVAWIIDADQDPFSGSLVGLAPGADRVVKLDWNFQASVVELWLRGDSGWVSLDLQRHTNYDGANPLVHVFLPLDELEDDGAFNYILTSTFGGSHGANEWAPSRFSFTTSGQYFTSSFGDPIACTSEEIPPPPPLPGEEEIEALIGDVERLRDEGVLSDGHATSLIAKLTAALELLGTKEPIGAARGLLSFVNEVEALLRSGILPESAGFPLVDSAEDAADLILASTSEAACLRSSSDPPPRPAGTRLRGFRDRSPLRSRR